MNRRNNLAFLVATIATIVVSFTLHAAEPREALIVFDLSTATDSANRGFFVDSLTDALRPTEEPKTATEVSEYIDAVAKNASPNRFIAGRGATVTIVAIYDLIPNTPPPTLKVEEKDRATRIADDLQTLVGIAKKVFKANEVEPRAYGSVIKTYTLTKPRATLIISSKSGEVEVSKTIITGPPEHLFLAADVAVTKLGDLKVSDGGGAIDVKEKPSSFYASANYALGDLYAQNAPWEGISLKGFASVSQRPFDSYGLGIGYRTNDFSVLGWDFSALSPFVGYFVTKTEVTAADGTKSHKDIRGWRAGISFNLDKALGWLGD